LPLLAPERGRFALGEGSRYGIVLVLLLGAVLVAIIWPPGFLSSLLTAALVGSGVLVAIGGGRRRGQRLILLGVVLLSVVVTGLARGSVASGIRDFLNAAVILVLPAIIVARFRRVLTVNVQTVLGAVCIYLVIGMLYANVDSGLSNFSGRQFLAGAANATTSDYMYFSFITLTTVGYGDLTPATGTARALAVAEALMGQLYLVTVIALLVGNFGRSQLPQRGSGRSGD
jgi:hypothetical protein